MYFDTEQYSLPSGQSIAGPNAEIIIKPTGLDTISVEFNHVVVRNVEYRGFYSAIKRDGSFGPYYYENNNKLVDRGRTLRAYRQQGFMEDASRAASDKLMEIFFLIVNEWAVQNADALVRAELKKHQLEIDRIDRRIERIQSELTDSEKEKAEAVAELNAFKRNFGLE